MNITKRIAGTIGATFVCLIIVYGLIALTARMSHPDTWILISFAIVILLSIYFCTFTILEEIRKVQNKDDASSKHPSDIDSCP